MRIITQRARKFLGLPASERGLLLRAWVLVWAARLALWVLPLPALRRWAERPPVAPGAHSNAPAPAHAATLHRRGHLLVADDYIAVAAEPQAAGPLLNYPGFPQLKLWPEAATATGADPAQLPQMRPDLEKRARRPETGFAGEALPLGRLYGLDEADRIAVESFDLQAALMELVRHSYAARALPRLDAASHLRQCAVVLRQTPPVRRLRRPRNLDTVDDVAACVAADASPALTD